MQKKVVMSILAIIFLGGISFTIVNHVYAAGANNYQNVINQVFQKPPGGGEGPNLATTVETRKFNAGGKGIRELLVFIAYKILIPVMVWVGIIIAILGFYGLMTYDNKEDLDKAENYLLRGVVGVMVMISAGYVTQKFSGDGGSGGLIGQVISQEGGGAIAESLYTQIAFPFLQIFLYIALGILFILVLSFGIKYIFGSDDNIQKKSLTVLLYNTMGIFVIIVAKTLVEAIYGKYNDVISGTGKTELGDIGIILDDPSARFADSGGLYSVINRILGIVTFIIVVIIIVQGYTLMTNPTSENTIKSLKKNLIYIFIGILVIGAGYLLTTFFIIT